MRTPIDRLGKVSITVEKDYWNQEKDYDKLVVVPIENEYITYISRKPVPAGTSLNDRNYWIPFSNSDSIKSIIDKFDNFTVRDLGYINEPMEDIIKRVRYDKELLDPSVSVIKFTARGLISAFIFQTIYNTGYHKVCTQYLVSSAQDIKIRIFNIDTQDINIPDSGTIQPWTSLYNIKLNDKTLNLVANSFNKVNATVEEKIIGSVNLSSLTSSIQNQLNTILNNPSEAIDSLNEIKDFLEGIEGTNLNQMISSISNNVETNIKPLIEKEITDRQKDVDSIWEAIIGKDVKFNFTISGSPGYINVEKDVTLNHSVVYNSTNLNHTIEVTHPQNDNITDKGNLKYTVKNSITFTGLFNVNSQDPVYKAIKIVNVSYSAYHPVFVGFGTEPSDVIIDSCKLAATSSSRQTYTRTNNKGSDAYFFIIVPDGVTKPNDFKMNGYGAAFNITNNYKAIVHGVSNVNYTVYKSGEIFENNKTITIVAS